VGDHALSALQSWQAVYTNAGGGEGTNESDFLVFIVATEIAMIANDMPGRWQHAHLGGCRMVASCVSWLELLRAYGHVKRVASILGLTDQSWKTTGQDQKELFEGNLNRHPTTARYGLGVHGVPESHRWILCEIFSPKGARDHSLSKKL